VCLQDILSKNEVIAMGITREQKQELDSLAMQVNFKVSARGPKIEMGNKCATVTLANTPEGFQQAKEYLWSMIEARTPKTKPAGFKE
jgi:hypothetical protein